ncbi:MAG: polysaccharide biosynthesis/export family protein [Pseudomonadota bacterium]
MNWAAKFPRYLLLATLAAAAPSCALMPSAGPSLDLVVDSADDEDFQYELIEVNRSVIDTLSTRLEPTLASAMGAQAETPERLLGVGDLVSVTVWEAAAGGLYASAGLSSSGGVGTVGASAVAIPPQRIDPSGKISVPYAGPIKAEGMRPDEVADAIVSALKGRAIEPQALVTVSESSRNQATVFGDVINGGRIPLVGQGERILDVIAAAGGVSAPIYSVSVRLTRGSQTAETPLHRVISNPDENIIVQPGDIITLFKNPETFTAFGATGSSTLASFDDERLMLDEALAKVGGVIDARGDPAGVFIFRYEPVSLISQLGGSSLEGADLTGVEAVAPVAYQIDLRKPAGLFHARNFTMRNKDILFVANSDASELRKVLSLIGAALSPVGSGANLARTVQ